MFFMWAAIFFLIALAAGAVGFTDISADASHIPESCSVFHGRFFSFYSVLVDFNQNIKSVARGVGINGNWRGLLRNIKIRCSSTAAWPNLRKALYFYYARAGIHPLPDARCHGADVDRLEGLGQPYD